MKALGNKRRLHYQLYLEQKTVKNNELNNSIKDKDKLTHSWAIFISKNINRNFTQKNTESNRGSEIPNPKNEKPHENRQKQICCS